MMKNWKRMISLLLCMAMILGNFPVVARATEADGLCPHHETHTDCGYVEGESVCGYVCELCAQATEETEPVCTGLADCVAEIHNEGCEKAAADAKAAEEEAARKAAEEKAAADKAAADAVAALIAALPALADIQAKPYEEQGGDYTQVNAAYDAYMVLTDDQKALLSYDEDFFMPYLQYFSGQTQEAAATSGSFDNGVTWSYDTGTKTLTISGNSYIDTDEDESSPWAAYCSELTTIVIEHGVTSIGEYAFDGCINLTSVTIPDSVISINEYAFWNCKALSNVNVGKNVTRIRTAAFYDCDSLTSVTIGNKVATIERLAFWECYNLTDVYYVGTEDQWAKIAIDTHNTALIDATKHYSCLCQSGHTFGSDYVCTVCGAVDLIDSGTCGSNLYWAMYADGRMVVTGSGSMKSYDYGSSPFDKYAASITSVELPQGITTIGERAFSYEYPNLDYIEIPTSVTHIKECAFGATYDNIKLKYPGSMEQWDKIVISSIASYVKQYGAECSDGIILYKGYCGGSDGLRADVKYVLMGDGTLKITGSGAMKFYRPLTQAHMSCFSGDSKILRVKIEEGITNIASHAFISCRNLTEVYIPASVRYIENEAFQSCSSLTDVYYGSNEKNWKKVSITEDGNTALANATIHYTDLCKGNHTWLPATCQAAKICEVCDLTDGEPDYDNHYFVNDLCACGAIQISEITFPDANFRSFITSQTYGEDSVLTSAELSNVKTISVNNKGIRVLTGIEYFTALTTLDCSENQLTSLNVSGLTALEDLYCEYNQLLSLNISGCTALKSLTCGDNQLTELDVSACTALRSLTCDRNQLTVLDVSNCNALSFLACNGNQLTSLNVSGCAALKSLYCNGNLLTRLDVSSCTALNLFLCRNNQLTSLDVGKCTALNQLVSDGNERTVSASQNRFDLSNLAADGFDISKASNWSGGTVDGSILTATAKTVTYTYDLGQNMTETFKLTIDGFCAGHTFAEKVDAQYLVSAATCTSAAVYYKSCSVCGAVGTETFESGTPDANNHNFVSDVCACGAVKISETTFPDANFRAYITSQTYGEDSVLTSTELSNVKTISVNNKGIKDLTGIEYFTALTDLSCYSNQLTALDVSKNVALTDLSCSSNQLTELDVSKNVALTSLSCFYNQLTALDVSKNTALRRLSCSSNQLTALDVSQNTALTNLYCSENQLTALDVSKNTALWYLSCYSNQLTALDVSQNTALKDLSCMDNRLTALDVSNNTALAILCCDSNQLTALNVSNNTALTILSCTSNKRTVAATQNRFNLNELIADGFDISKASNWQGGTVDGNILTVTSESVTYTYDLGNEETATFTLAIDGFHNHKFVENVDDQYLVSAATCTSVAVYYKSCSGCGAVGTETFTHGELDSTNHIFVDDVCACGAIQISEITFPDANFRSFITSQTYGTDGVLTSEELSNVKTISVNNKGIKDLTGIEYFTALTYLYCYSNQLTELDVSKNVELTYLDCYSNQLTELDVSKNVALTYLNCYSNQLTELDVSKNVALTVLCCSSNQLAELDVSKNVALTNLNCYSNQLTELDVSKNVALTVLYCSSNQLAELDVSKNVELTGMYCDENQLMALDVSKNVALTVLYCGSNRLTELDVSKNAALTYLSCGFNQLTELDVSKNTALETLWCYNNQLTSLDVSKNVALTELYCSSNQLTELDVSKNVALTNLICFFNERTVTATQNRFNLNELIADGFDISKASNWSGGTVDGNILTVTSETVTYTYDLGRNKTETFTLKIDGFCAGHTFAEKVDAQYLVSAATCTSAAVYYKSCSVCGAVGTETFESGTPDANNHNFVSDVCACGAVKISETTFPDAIFRAYITRWSYGNDGVLTYAERSKMTSIDVENRNIKDLTGIEHFTALTYLNCTSNQLTELDVSKNNRLEKLYCGLNQLTELDVSKNTALETLRCDSNSLTSLDVSKNTALIALICHKNRLMALDVSNNTALESLYCGSNQLMALDVSKNTVLNELCCEENQLAVLDVSKNIMLERLYCYSNQLVALDVSKNPYIKSPSWERNERTVIAIQNRFDLSDLAADGFDISKASNWQGGTVSGNILTATAEKVTYTYDAGYDAGISWPATFTLKIEGFCDHNFVEKVDAQYLVSEATCTAQAEYYKSCSVCGDKGTETFKHGNLNATNHVGGTEIRDDKSATCTVDGYTGDTWCLGCETKIDDGEAITAPGHKMGQWTTVSTATCAAKGSDRRDCEACDHFETRETEMLKHSYESVVTPPVCEDKGYTTHTCAVCGDVQVDSYVDELGHEMGEWTVVTEPAPGADGEERRECSRCDHYESRPVQYQGNILKLEGEDLLRQSVVYINGLPYAVKGEGENRYVEIPDEEDFYMVTYSYHVGDASDIHTQYPTGMKAYKVKDGKITYIPELDNLLQYSGSSIRITGNKGIRMITSLTKDTKAALTGNGLAGYKLLEYGTALCFASEVAGDGDLVLGKSYTRSNYAYKRGVADPVFATSGNLTQYTNVLVGFSLDQCKDDIAMRPYIILEDANGEQVTLYGGTIYRSIGYIAYQNRNVFQPKTASYNYVWEIIHHVYGDKYDADYKG